MTPLQLLLQRPMRKRHSDSWLSVISTNTWKCAAYMIFGFCSFLRFLVVRTMNYHYFLHRSSNYICFSFYFTPFKHLNQYSWKKKCIWLNPAQNNIRIVSFSSVFKTLSNFATEKPNIRYFIHNSEKASWTIKLHKVYNLYETYITGLDLLVTLNRLKSSSMSKGLL